MVGRCDEIIYEFIGVSADSIDCRPRRLLDIGKTDGRS